MWTQGHRMSVIRGVWVSSVQSLYLMYGKLRPERDLPKATPEVGAIATPPDLRSKAMFSAFLPLSLTSVLWHPKPDLDFDSWLSFCPLLSTFVL